MKLGKKILAFALAVCLTVGLLPVGSVSHAEGTASGTLLLEDHFSGASWSTSASTGKWRLSSGQYCGSIDTANGVAPLGWSNTARNLYDGTGASGLTDVHLKADVCVTGEYAPSGKVQYHFLTARGSSADGTGSIAFGFKTADGATKSSLVVGYYTARDNFTPYYEGTAIYTNGADNKHMLELYVVGTLIIAKCDGATVYAEQHSDIRTSGYCGIVDHRASSNTSGTTYGTDYQKGGYFDNVYLYHNVTLDQYKVDDLVVVDEEGNGVADIKICSNDVEVATLSDVSISIPSVIDMQGGMHQGAYNATATILGQQQNLTVNKVFVESESCQLAIYEDFSTNALTDTTIWRTNTGVTFANEEALMAKGGELRTNDNFTDGYIEAKITFDDLSTVDADSSTTFIPAQFVAKVNNSINVNARFQVKKANEGYTASVQLWRTESGNEFAAPITLKNFCEGATYTVRLTNIGNMVELAVNDEVVRVSSDDSTSALPENSGTFRLMNDSSKGVPIIIDDLTIVEYTPVRITTSAVANGAVSLPQEKDFSYGGTNQIYNERTSYLPGEEVTVTTTPADGYQLAAVGGLTYTFDGAADSSTFIIDDRTGNAGDNQGTCNEFVFKMPSSDITIAADYVSEAAAEAPNMGIRKVNLREKTDSMKRGIRFNSRAYKEFIVNGEVYKLTDASTIGTLVFKQGTVVNEEILKSCLNNNGYVVEGATLGMKVQSTKLQDLCDEYVDWGLVLSYNEDSALFDSEYIVYSYAVYDVNGTMTPVFSDAKAYSYNEVATALGYEAIVNE